MCTSDIGLESLPVELFYELQLYALSSFLPCTSRYIFKIFHSAPSSFRAEYILGRVFTSGSTDSSNFFTKALRYPLCTKEVLDSICRQIPEDYLPPSCDLPRRLFRLLAPKVGPIKWREREQPMPFLRYLSQLPKFPSLNANAHDGYALAKAVHAKFIPLVRFLLEHGASPRHKNSLSVMIAIRQKDLSLVKLLIERDGSPVESGDRKSEKKGKRKKRKLEDRVEVNREMLKAAVRCDARDIVEYLTREKGCIPDMQTLHMMMK